MYLECEPLWTGAHSHYMYRQLKKSRLMADVFVNREYNVNNVWRILIDNVNLLYINV